MEEQAVAKNLFLAAYPSEEEETERFFDFMFLFPYTGSFILGYFLLLIAKKSSLLPTGVLFNYVLLYLSSISTSRKLAVLQTFRAVYVQTTGSIFYFCCLYFVVLLFSLIVLLTLSSNCFSMTDNIVFTACSYIVSIVFLVLFFLLTKDSMGGAILSAFLATTLFILLELFLIALIIIVIVEPLFILNAGVELFRFFSRGALLLFPARGRSYRETGQQRGAVRDRARVLY